MAKLISKDAKVFPNSIAIEDGTITLGRHPDCDVVIDDISVSRRHAQVKCDAGVYYLQDLGSRNGTRLNGSVIQRPARLFDGAAIKVCDYDFTFQLEDRSAFHDARPTMERDSDHQDRVILEDDDRESTVMSQLDVPSHHDPGLVSKNAEAKLRALIQIAQALSQSVVLEEVLEDILDCLFSLFSEADRGFIVFKDPDGSLRPMAVKMRQPDDERVRISRTIVNRVIDTRRPLISSDASGDFNLSQSITDFKIRSIMCVPLLNTEDQAMGVIQLDTLRNRIAFQESDLEVLVTVAMQASLGIQRLRLIEETVRMKGIENDLRLAHEVQQSFLPQRNPEFEGYDFYSFYSATMHVGGDYFDYIPVDDDKLAIVVADVVGHGIAAALLMAKVAAESRFAVAATRSPAEAIVRVNRSLSGLNLDQFVTLLICQIERSTNQVRIVNAGHMPPILRRPDGSVEVTAQRASGIPVGIFEDSTYEEATIELEPGDILVTYTDGINEAMNAEGEQLGTQRMLEALADPACSTAALAGKKICQTVSEHLDGQPPTDDMCLVCVGRVN